MTNLLAQTYLGADFELRQFSEVDSSRVLVQGHLHYFLNDSLVYEIAVPETTRLVFRDTAVIMQFPDSTETRTYPTDIAPTTLYHQILTGTLHTYGMEDAPYRLAETQQVDTVVIALWKPTRKWRKKLGPIKLVHYQGRLVVANHYYPDGSLAVQNFFEKYQTIAGLPVPTQITQIYHTPEGKIYRRTILKNVEIR